VLVAILNGLIEVLYLIASGIAALLPDSPFQFESLDLGVFGQIIGLVFPVGDMATHMTLILSAFAMYYIVRWLLRLIRQIQ
jgi:hypothetical protein